MEFSSTPLRTSTDLEIVGGDAIVGLDLQCLIIGFESPVFLLEVGFIAEFFVFELLLEVRVDRRRLGLEHILPTRCDDRECLTNYSWSQVYCG